jgi:hypothetical protein
MSLMKIFAKVKRSSFLRIAARSQCYKTLIYHHTTVTPSFCVIEQ